MLLSVRRAGDRVGGARDVETESVAARDSDRQHAEPHRSRSGRHRRGSRVSPHRDLDILPDLVRDSRDPDRLEGVQKMHDKLLGHCDF